MKIDLSKLRHRAGEAFRASGPYLTSLVVHTAALVALSLILLPVLPGGNFHRIFLASQSEPEKLDAMETPLVDTVLANAGTSENAPDAAAAFNSATENLAVQVDALASASAISLHHPVITSLERVPEPLEAETPLDDQISKRWGTKPRAPSTTNEVRAGTNPGEALLTVTAAIKRELEEDDTLIVWLADASASLQHDRELMAEHMKSFYQSIGAFGGEKREGNLLFNAVAAYGANVVEISRPNPMGGRVVAALKEIPTDLSGLENVMSAVQWALQEYRFGRRRRERMIIVIITDESGDDTQLLESTLEACQTGHVAIHVIGPSAVLGADRGSHSWVDPATGNEYLLPVVRGPDTALPERAWLPYWFEGGPPPWLNRGIQVAMETRWYGGHYRERLISPFGPYALTRLALQTGGSFTVLDRAADRSRYDLEKMRDYLPQYLSLEEYESTLRDRPLRLAVVGAASATLRPQVAVALSPPPMSFFDARHYEFPFKPYRVYKEPQIFAREFLATLERADNGVAAKQKALFALLAPFRKKNIDWDRAYSSEESARWKAWYDLTKGRLLATLVRCNEYRSACRELPSRIPAGANHVSLTHNKEVVAPQSKEVAEEATLLLKRCIKNNPDTPWADLAQWELDKGFGMGFNWQVLPRPAPSAVPPLRAPVVPNFPRM